MTRIRHLIAGFIAGEISPLMRGRVDTELYAYALETCENFVPINEGPLVKRPGFEYICDADPSSTWLSAFRFSVTQEYVIEWGELQARFFTNGGRIETAPGVAYEVVTPYPAADAADLDFQQSYDRLYIDHPGYAPGYLLRTGAAAFSYAATVLKNGPFKDQNTDKSVTVSVNAASGSGITISASDAIFAAGHVGALFEIEALDYSDIPAWEAGAKDIVIGYRCRSDGKVYEAQNANIAGSIVPTHDEGTEWDGVDGDKVDGTSGNYGIKWKFLYRRQGRARITAVAGDGLSATADVELRLADSLTSVASYRWAHQAFSAEEGWPSLVLNWGGRQLHFKDFLVCGSVVGDFGGGQVNFEARTSSDRTAADLAFRRSIAAEDPPLWAAGDRKILVGTASKEMALGPVNAQAALSGDNISAEPQSFYGCESVRPVQVGVNTIFVERGGRRLRAGNYDFSSDRYQAADMTAAARHVTSSGIVQLAYQRIPYALLYAVRQDGQLVAHADTRLEMKGFARAVLGGDAKALSAVSVVGADGLTDELWLLVERSRADGTKREIWRQTAWRELGAQAGESFYVDCGTRIEASGGQATFTGFTHLAGQDLAVLVNGAVVPSITVNMAGEFTLPAASVPSSDFIAIVGLPYTARAVTLPPEVKLRSGTMQGLRQRLVKVVARLLESMGITAGAPGGRAQDLIDRKPSDLMDQAVPLFTGDTSGEIDAAFGRSGQVEFVSADPLPAIVTSAMLNIDVDDKDV